MEEGGQRTPAFCPIHRRTGWSQSRVQGGSWSAPQPLQVGAAQEGSAWRSRQV